MLLPTRSAVGRLLVHIRACSYNASSPTIRVSQLKTLIESSPHLRLLDAAYSPAPCAGPVGFQEKNLYGKIDDLAKLWANSDYEKEHIPGAVHFNNDVATYPGEYEKQALYDKEIFQMYARKLGINQDSDIVIYSRGMAGGMLFAARAWWLLKVYGAEKVRVLEGGLDKWKAEGGEVTDATAIVKPGNFEAKDPGTQFYVTFDEIFIEGTCDGERRNLLDARPAAQYTGAEPLAFPPNGARGAHLKGAKNIPISSLIAKEEMKGAEELNEVFEAAGVSAEKDSITYCNSGQQASLVALALAKAGRSCRVFNGSLIEVSKRQPSLISAK